MAGSSRGMLPSLSATSASPSPCPSARAPWAASILPHSPTLHLNPAPQPAGAVSRVPRRLHAHRQPAQVVGGAAAGEHAAHAGGAPVAARLRQRLCVPGGAKGAVVHVHGTAGITPVVLGCGSVQQTWRHGSEERTKDGCHWAVPAWAAGSGSWQLQRLHTPLQGLLALPAGLVSTTPSAPCCVQPLLQFLHVAVPHHLVGRRFTDVAVWLFVNAGKVLIGDWLLAWSQNCAAGSAVTGAARSG